MALEFYILNCRINFCFTFILDNLPRGYMEPLGPNNGEAGVEYPGNRPTSPLGQVNGFNGGNFGRFPPPPQHEFHQAAPPHYNMNDKLPTSPLMPPHSEASPAGTGANNRSYGNIMSPMASGTPASNGAPPDMSPSSVRSSGPAAPTTPSGPHNSHSGNGNNFPSPDPQQPGTPGTAAEPLLSPMSQGGNGFFPGNGSCTINRNGGGGGNNSGTSLAPPALPNGPTSPAARTSSTGSAGSILERVLGNTIKQECNGQQPPESPGVHPGGGAPPPAPGNGEHPQDGYHWQHLASNFPPVSVEEFLPNGGMESMTEYQGQGFATAPNGHTRAQEDTPSATPTPNQYSQSLSQPSWVR